MADEVSSAGLSYRYGPVNASGNAIVHLGDKYLSSDPQREEYQRFLNSLRFPEIHAREERLAQAHDGTFEWMFDENKRQTEPPIAAFYDWLQLRDHGSTFWIRGKAGSGKSTFMGFLTENDRCLELLGGKGFPRQLVVLKYFFWELGTPLQYSVAGLLRSFLWQIFVNNPELGFESWQRELRAVQSRAWTSKILSDILEKMLTDPNRTFCLFIDGLDECSARDELMRVLKKLEAIPNVRICASSRPEPKFEFALKHWPLLRLDQLTHGDMQKFAADELEDYLIDWTPGGVVDEERVKRLVSRLLEKAHGVFLWLRIAVKSLKEGIESRDHWEMLLARLEEMPDDVHQLYLHMVSRGNSNLKRYSASAAHMFKLLLHTSSEVMTLARMAWVLNGSLRHEALSTLLNHSSMDSFCQRLNLKSLRVWIPSHSANFVELWESPSKHPTSHKQPHPDNECVYDHLTAMLHSRDTSVAFMHGTVGEFLQNTVEGRHLTDTCLITKPDMTTSLFEADLLLMICEVLGGKQPITEALCRYFKRIIRAHISYEHWWLLEACTMSILGTYHTDPWYRTFILRSIAPDVPPPCQDGWLYWCVMQGQCEYVKDAVRDPLREIPQKTLLTLLRLHIARLGQMCVSADDHEVKDDYLELLQVLLQAGADASASIADTGESAFCIWGNSVSLVLYCLDIIRLHAHQMAMVQLSQAVIHLLLDNGAETSLVVPPPLFEFFRYPAGTFAQLQKDWFLVMAPDPLWVTRHHSQTCTAEDVRSLAAQLLYRITYTSSEHTERVVLYSQAAHTWWALAEHDAKRIQTALLEHHAAMMTPHDAALRSALMSPLGPSIIPLYSSDTDTGGRELLEEALSCSIQLYTFEAVLQYLAWPEDKIRLAISTPELRQWYQTVQDLEPITKKYDRRLIEISVPSSIAETATPSKTNRTGVKTPIRCLTKKK